MSEVVGLILIGLLPGILIGATLKNIAWSGNAKRVQRIAYRGKFYKVVELDNLKSTEYFEMNNLV